MRTLLHIGEIAQLLGVTPKAIRHYHKVGLLAEPERTEAGYRLYGAQDLLRLQRIRRLQALGLSLKQIKVVLGNPKHEHTLRQVLQSLDEELSAEMRVLEERREKIRKLLNENALDTLDQPLADSPTFQFVQEHLAEYQSRINSTLWKQETQLYALFALLLIVVLGPCAGAAGRLYVAAFQMTQSWDRSRKAATIPGVHALTSVFARSRTLAGAFFVKMLLGQSRNVTAWMRMGVVLIVLAFFPQLHAVAAHYGWSDMLFVAGFAAGLAMLGVVEQAPNAISGEANRLMLYLSAPLELSRLLWVMNSIKKY